MRHAVSCLALQELQGTCDIAQHCEQNRGALLPIQEENLLFLVLHNDWAEEICCALRSLGKVFAKRDNVRPEGRDVLLLPTKPTLKARDDYDTPFQRAK